MGAIALAFAADLIVMVAPVLATCPQSGMCARSWCDSIEMVRNPYPSPYVPDFEVGSFVRLRDATQAERECGQTRIWVQGVLMFPQFCECPTDQACTKVGLNESDAAMFCVDATPIVQIDPVINVEKPECGIECGSFTFDALRGPYEIGEFSMSPYACQCPSGKRCQQNDQLTVYNRNYEKCSGSLYCVDANIMPLATPTAVLPAGTIGDYHWVCVSLQAQAALYGITNPEG